MIFYFSGTGNTKWAAARLAAATHEDLIPIAPYMRADDSSHNIAEPFILKENERLGFVFPRTWLESSTPCKGVYQEDEDTERNS